MLRDGAAQGPHSAETLRQAVLDRRLVKDDLIWRLGWEDWREAGTLVGLFLPPKLDPATIAASDSVERADANSAALATCISPPLPDSAKHIARTHAPALQASHKDALVPDLGSTSGADLTLPGVANYSTSRNYLVRHWRGELSLPVAFWVNGLLFKILFTIATALFFAFLPLIGMSTTIAAVIVGLLLLALLLWVWQGVGVWRSATHHKDRGGRAFWAGLAQIMVVLGALHGLLDLSQSFLPATLEYARIALGDQDLGDTRLRLLRDGTEIELSGGIKFGTAEKLAALLETAPQVRALRLDSHGGRIGEADRIAQIVRARKLITYVSDHCESACTHIFLAGRERWMAAGAKLGFHQPDFPGMTALERMTMLRDERATLIAAGLPKSFADRAMATPPSSMWYPSGQALLEAHIISGISSADAPAGSQTAASPQAAIRWKLIMQKFPALDTLQRSDPKLYQWLESNFSEAVRLGRSQDEVTELFRGYYEGIVGDFLPRAASDMIMERNDITLDYLKILRRSDSQSCFVYLSGDKATSRSILSALAPDVARREAAFDRKLLEAGRQDNVPPTSIDVATIQRNVFATARHSAIWQDDLLDAKTLTFEQYKRFCDMNILFYETIKALPRNEAVSLLRNLYSQ